MIRRCRTCVVRVRVNIDIADEFLALVLNEKGEFDFNRIIPPPAIPNTEAKWRDDSFITDWERRRRGVKGNAFHTTVIEPDRKEGRYWAEVSFSTAGLYPAPVLKELSCLFPAHPIAVVFSSENIGSGYHGGFYLVDGRDIEAPIFAAEACAGLSYPNYWAANWDCLVVNDDELASMFGAEDPPFPLSANDSVLYDPFLILPGFREVIDEGEDLNRFWIKP